MCIRTKVHDFRYVLNKYKMKYNQGSIEIVQKYKLKETIQGYKFIQNAQIKELGSA